LADRRSVPRDPRLSEVRTTEQVAQALGIKPASVRRAVLRGAAPAPDYKLGNARTGLTLWHVRTLESWLEKRKPEEQP
jgi:hypothetical protein